MYKLPGGLLAAYWQGGVEMIGTRIMTRADEWQQKLSNINCSEKLQYILIIFHYLEALFIGLAIKTNLSET